jgi:hypothetical protein
MLTRLVIPRGRAWVLVVDSFDLCLASRLGLSDGAGGGIRVVLALAVELIGLRGWAARMCRCQRACRFGKNMDDRPSIL